MILTNSKAVIHYGGDQAFYSLATDHIQLPPDRAFIGEHHWAATALHELEHGTGHSSRLARGLRNRFGPNAYAQEELRAELFSLFVGAELGWPCDTPNHTSYVAGWLKALKDDKKKIFRAASDAQTAADIMLAMHPDYARQARVSKEPVQLGTVNTLLPSPSRTKVLTL